MTRREELAAIRERVGAEAEWWEALSTPGPAEVRADRRFLLGLVDELAAALVAIVGEHVMQRGYKDNYEPDWCNADGSDWPCPTVEKWGAFVSDLGPDA